MARINRFEEIEAWQIARILTRRIYEITNEGAFARDFGLRDQMRRATVSVMSYIAKGLKAALTNCLSNSWGARKPHLANCAPRSMWRWMPAP